MLIPDPYHPSPIHMAEPIASQQALREHRRVLQAPALLRAPLVALALFIAALLPRAFGVGRFVTVDEGYHWFERVDRFLNAVQAGDWAGTNLVGHPGVTTLWLGAIGRSIHDILAQQGLIAANDPELLRAAMRLPVAIVAALCVALGYLLLRRLVSAPAALLAALLWATEPFLVAHAQLLHLDALLASFMTLSILAALVWVQTDRVTNDQRPTTNDQRPTTYGPNISRPDRSSKGAFYVLRSTFYVLHSRGWLAVSALFAGLALLTKSPSVLLFPLIGLVVILDLGLRMLDPSQSRIQSLTSQIAESLVSYAVWCLLAFAVFVALWPAAWADLRGSIGSILHQASSDGGSPHGWGNFFFGRAVADPGPLFYPVALAFRLAPWTLIGLIVYIVVTILELRAGASTARQALSNAERRTGLALLLFALLFVGMMTVPPKKFDRYLLPIVPALTILAAIGLVHARDWAIRFSKTKIQNPKSKILLPLVILVLGANLVWYHPYELAYYNPLLGGARAAVRTIAIGWGEGFEQVGDYISAQTDGADYPVASWFAPSLQPFVQAPVVPLSWVLTPGRAGYAVLYIDQLQRGNEPEATALLRSQFKPVHVVRIHGIDYAEIYQLPRPAAQPLAAGFGPAIDFRGYDLDTSALAANRTVRLAVHWQARERVPADYTLFIHVLDAAGHRIGQADVPPAGPRDPTSTWREGQFATGVHQVPVWGGTGRGPLWLAIGLYDPQSGARLPLRMPPPSPGAPAAGTDALLIGPIRLAP